MDYQYSINGKSISSIYPNILNKILTEGKEVGPHGLKTRELIGVSIVSQNPTERLFGHPVRKEVAIFTYIEGLWMLLGENTRERVCHYVPAMGEFLNEETNEFDGAYGPFIRGSLSSTRKRDALRTRDQFKFVYEKLLEDPDSRQAIIVINDPHVHGFPTKDFPCTLNFQFLIRDDKLHMIANMRSQDAWYGFIYDTGEFQWFQEIMAGFLGIDPGFFMLNVGSLHLYERHWGSAAKLVDENPDWDLYRFATKVPCRYKYEDFQEKLDKLSLWEEACRTGAFDTLIPDASHIPLFPVRRMDFFANLSDVILAYNLRLSGHKDASEEIIRKNQTDLGLIYRMRWLKDDVPIL